MSAEERSRFQDKEGNIQPPMRSKTFAKFVPKLAATFICWIENCIPSKIAIINQVNWDHMGAKAFIVTPIWIACINFLSSRAHDGNWTFPWIIFCLLSYPWFLIFSQNKTRVPVSLKKIHILGQAREDSVLRADPFFVISSGSKLVPVFQSIFVQQTCLYFFIFDFFVPHRHQASLQHNPCQITEMDCFWNSSNRA